MAVQFLTGLNVAGNINLNDNQLQNVIVQPLGADPSGVAGKIYYNSASNKLRLYDGTAWVDLTTGGADTNTTYDLSGVGSTNGTAGVRLAGSDGTNDDVLVVGAGTTSVTRSGNTLTVTSSDSAVGTVTDVLGGSGISISGTSTVTPTVNIVYSGVKNAIDIAPIDAIKESDYLWFSQQDGEDPKVATIKRVTLANMPGFGKDGTVTSVGSGAGLTGGAITGSGSLAVDYAGTDNVVLAAADGTAIDLVATDKILFSDDTDKNAYHANLSQVASYINAGAGTVTSVDGSGGTTGLTLTGGAITSAGTLTLGGTLIAANGGTGHALYAVGDILFASATDTLSKLGIGSAGQVLKVASGIPSWATDANAGGTVTSITLAADSGTGTAVTSAGTFTFDGGTNVTTSVSGTTVTINSTDQYVGTVTSVTASNGAKVTGTVTTVPNVEVDYSATGVIDSAGGHSGSAESDDLILLGDDSASGVVVKASLSDIPLNVLGAPNASLGFGNQKGVNAANPTAAQDVATKNYVDTTFAGSGALIFQGGYDATNNSPVLDNRGGATPIAVKQGWTYAVTTGGTFYAEVVEDGDLLIAEVDGAASLAEWTVVQNNIGIASAAATDGATVKGIAGFDSATFDVSATGWAQVKAGGISDAQLASTFNKIIGTDVDLDTSDVDVVDQINVTDGVITSMSKRTLPTATTGAVGVAEIATDTEVRTGTDTTRYVTPASLAAATGGTGLRSYTGLEPSASAGASWTLTAGTHKMGAGNFIVQTYDEKGTQLYMDVSIAANGDISFACSASQGQNSIRTNVIKVG